ncbi:hypothetical protein EW35_3207 [Staphylococcus aureus]|nr:hypothetical protein EW35_3207 [Staphylococcus aureus]
MMYIIGNFSIYLNGIGSRNVTEIVFYKIYFVVTPQLAHYCKLTFRQLLCWGPPTCIVCRISFEILYVGPPIIENACYMGIFIRSTTTNIICRA